MPVFRRFFVLRADSDSWPLSVLESLSLSSLLELEDDELELLELSEATPVLWPTSILAASRASSGSSSWGWGDFWEKIG